MKKKLLPVALLLISIGGFSQKGIKGLINAEKAFASFTESHTIREGFLQYMDSTGVVFQQGNAVNALALYQKQKAGPPVLSWHPVFAVVSASGDIGITTGPYEVRSKSLEETPVAHGSFSSVWQINKEGEWKNIVDLGTSYQANIPTVKEVQGIALPVAKGTKNFSYKEILALDTKFNTAIQEKNEVLLLSCIAPDSWLNINGLPPVTGDNTIKKTLLNLPKDISLNTLTGNISTSGDLAYVYGTIQKGNRKENYLRAWIYRNKQWQVILQTITIEIGS